MKWFLDWLQTPEGRITVAIIVLPVIVGMVIPPLGRLLLKFLRYVCRLPKRGWRMLKNWFYRLKYHPSYELSQASDIRCDDFNSRYKLTLWIEVNVRNNDDSTEIMFDFHEAELRVYLRNISGRNIDCLLDWADGDTTKWIKNSDGNVKICYSVSGFVNCQPKMGEMVICKSVRLGTYSLRGTRPLRWKNIQCRLVANKGENNSG